MELSEAQDKKDLQEALNLLTSPEWKQYVRFLKEKSERHLMRTLGFIRAENLIQAQIQVALYDEVKRLENTFRQQILQKKDSLKKQEELSHG